MLRTSSIPLTKVKFQDSKDTQAAIDKMLKKRQQQVEEVVEEKVEELDEASPTKVEAPLGEIDDQGEQVKAEEVPQPVEVDEHLDFKKQLNYFVKKLNLRKRKRDQM